MQDALDRGIQLFNEHAFFECHEVLEAAWITERGRRRWFLQALIHLAVGFYHQERGNRAGATRQLRKGLKKLASYLPSSEGVDTWALYSEATGCLEAVERGEPLTTIPAIRSWSARL